VHHHNLFNDKAELYESSRPIYPQEIYSYLANLCPSNGLVWDSACGNGQAAIGLIKEFDCVYATDVSKEQIDNAKPHPKIVYEVSPSEKVNLENESCDLICVAQALHWFDRNLFWPEAQRVLKPNGIFCAFGYNWASVDTEIDRSIESSFMKVIEPFWARQNKLLWNHYRDLKIPFERIYSPNFRMEVNWDLNEYFNYLHTFSATRRCMDSIGNEFFNKAYEEVGYLWGNSDKSKNISLDFVFYAGRKKYNKSRDV
jgi:SAM-dependent methyltransferase